MISQTYRGTFNIYTCKCISPKFYRIFTLLQKEETTQRQSELTSTRAESPLSDPYASRS